MLGMVKLLATVRLRFWSEIEFALRLTESFTCNVNCWVAPVSDPLLGF